MRLPKVQVRLRWLMALVALAAVPMAIWSAWFNPRRMWQRAVVDGENGARRWHAISEMASGKASVDKATALATLTSALRSPSYGVREVAAAGIGHLGSAARPAAPALIRVLADPDPSVRCRGAAALESILPPGDRMREAAVPALKRLLGDRSWDVRLKAASALVEFGHGGDAVSVLVDALGMSDYMTQSEALWLLGRIGPAAAGDALAEVKALEARARMAVAPDLARYLRVYAAHTRYLLGDRVPALAALRAFAKGPDADLAREATRVLSRLPVVDPNLPGSVPGTQ